MKTIDGEKIASCILTKIKKTVSQEKLKPKLGAILAGNNPVSLTYIRQKEKACKKTGIDFSLFQFPANIKSSKLESEVRKISSRLSGIIIQLPLPFGMKDQAILNAIPEGKDIDVLSSLSLGKFYAGDVNRAGFTPIPPIVKAISIILNEEKIILKGKYVVVVGFGRLVGKPLSFWLMSQGATVSVLNEHTSDMSIFTRQADILFSGVGIPGLINGKMVKKGSMVVDTGTSIESGSSRGDIDFKSVSLKAGIVVPVPGGVGPVTTACLIENLVELSLKNKK